MVSYRMVLVLNLMLRLTEGRVYCQDSHASPWVPLGYSCPVMCQDIINAINILKLIDHRKLLEMDQRFRHNLNESYVSKVMLSHSSEEEDDDIEVVRSARTEPYHKDGESKHYTNFKNEKSQYIKYLETKKNKAQEKKDKYFENIDKNIADTSRETSHKMTPNQNGVSLFEYNKKYTKVVPEISHKHINIQNYTPNKFTKMAGNNKDLQKAVDNAVKNTCDWFKNKQPNILIKKMVKNCTNGNRRNGYGDDFIRILTRTMNRYALTSFQFTEDMVELVLEKVFGKNVDNVFDLGKFLRYLKHMLKVHKAHRRRDTTIVLKPRHCLSLSIPGCFCIAGFVENAGQCVKPADCYPDTSDEDYLSRVVVH